ncbi:HNH endonuclease [Staphylococcus epidermidis]|uniref:HNH endonuclease n=1 Tax=Staphylococcus epidermidis TaxID=1282 RepID=UPI0002991EF0|nr:HNH endonuclease [Staphylococcus epidermidis]EKS24423.1 hypothetical protein HMPREF9281_02326 [Staphylococcus epidermidis BVS058A4]
MKNTMKKYQLDEMIEAGLVKQFEQSERKIYYVSKYGNFYSQSKSNPEDIRQMSLVPDGEGYLRCQINKKTTKVHIVVAETFIRPREPKEVINHLNSNRENNDLSNIVICSQSENIKHAWEFRKERNRLIPEQAKQIRMLYQVEGMSLNTLARMFGTRANCVKQIIEYKTYVNI